MVGFTVNEVIKKLQEIVAKEPHKGEVDLWVHITDMEDLIDNGESPQPIQLIDDDISDRVDINI